MTPFVRITIIATLLAIAIAQVAIGIANAGSLRYSPRQSIISCNSICVHGLNGGATKYWKCTNNLTGQIVSVQPSSPPRPCF